MRSLQASDARAFPSAVPPAGEAPRISVVVPIYDEEESIPILVARLVAALDGMEQPYEIIAVNDGSRDGSQRVLREEAARLPQLKVVEFRRNFGQTAALMAGIDHAAGEIIVTIDADLQNDPDDIPMLIETLGEDYDVVSGWRKERQDAAIKRNFVSRVANAIISRVSGVKLHDYGCTLKAYRRDILEGVRLYGEMHRFVPIYASWVGARVTEVPVSHHTRQLGKSKYGLNRILKVILDLMVVKFMSRYLVKPIYVFGGVGLAFFAMSAAAFVWMLWLKFVHGTSMIETPLPILVAMLIMLGFMTLLMGILAEVLSRTYFESQGRRPYSIRRIVNGPS